MGLETRRGVWDANFGVLAVWLPTTFSRTGFELAERWACYTALRSGGQLLTDDRLLLAGRTGSTEKADLAQ